MSRLKLWEERFAGQRFKLHPFPEAIIRRIYGPNDAHVRRLVRMACTRTERLILPLGIDLSSVEDLSAVVAVFPDGDGESRRYDVLPMFFLPETGLARKAERDRADYVRWKEDGFLTVTGGNVIDHSAIVDYVVSLGERYGVQEIAIDRWNSTAVNTSLQEEGFTINQFGQGFASMAAPVKELKRAILSRGFRHGGNPILRMCFGNVVAEGDAAENEKFTKERARGRIDGAVASAMAVGRILANETGPSLYETQRPEGFLVL